MTLNVPDLRTILITTSSLIILTVSSFITYFNILQYRTESIGHVHHYADTVAGNIASAEAEYLITESYASLQDSLFSFQQRPHIESISILSPDGHVIADTEPERLGSSLDISEPFDRLKEGETTRIDFKNWRTTTLAPIRINDELIGWCRLDLNIEYIQEGMTAIHKKSFYTCIIAVILAAVIFFFLSTIITRPLKNLINAADKVAKNDFDQQADVVGALEVRKLAQIFNKMVAALKQREAQLRQAQKMEAMGELSASIVHEFGNPLLGVSFLLNNLNKHAQLGKKDKELIGLGLEECNRMKSFLRDLKYFYRPSSEQKNFADIHHIIDNVLLFHKTYLEEKDIRVVRKYDTHLPKVKIVEDQITQVIINLIINAVEAITKENGSLFISTTRENDMVNITIRDNGVGIDEEDIKKIFDPFFSTKPEVEGTGLGLSVSYGIVKSHKGDILVASTPGKGTSFTILLPINSND